MEKYAKITVALLLTAAVCSCSRIPDHSEPDSLGSSDISDSSDTTSDGSPEEFPLKEFNIVKKESITKLNAEGGVYDGEYYDGGEESGLDGRGYIALKKGGSLTHVYTAETSQHYRVIIAVRSVEGASVKLDIGGKVEGSYFIPPHVSDEEDGESGNGFTYYAVEHIFFNVGNNTLNFSVEEGSLDIDYLLVESMDAVSDNCYNTGNACVSPKASANTVLLMNYLSSVYGKRVLTAQNVSTGTNAEIDAVFKETGRYPAIRVGELAPLLKDEESAEKAVKDIELALEWSEAGGIAAYTWHWYSPNYKRGTEPSDFDFAAAMRGQEVKDAALLDDSDIAAMLEKGYIEPELAALLEDIDKLAHELKKLDDMNVPVIFEPIPDGDTGLYWWGASADSYKQLWTLLFDRLCTHHDLRNIIWVWNGSSNDYYPGNNMVDIIGQSFYEKSDSAFAGRFAAVAGLNTARKIQAITACDTLPDIDNMFRDNALWLWTAADSGEYIINKHGSLVDIYTKRSALRRIYNHQRTIARDELEI